MAVEPSETPDLQAIAGPITAPPEEPDTLTERAIKKAKADAKKPLPAERLEIHLLTRITETSRERDRLATQNFQLQQQLAELVPEIKRLKEASAHSVFVNLVATTSIAIGGVLVSGATYHTPYTKEMLWFGYGIFVIGLALLFLYTIFYLFRR